MGKTFSDYVSEYKHQLENGDIQTAYKLLVNYVMQLKTHFEKAFSDKYSCGNVSPGYMDFTYFPFFNTFLRDKKLRFGIVFCHEQARFELWLMGQNADIQKKYWDLLKTSKWNENVPAMPKYSVLEAVLVESPDFNDLDKLTDEILKKTDCLSDEITCHIKSIL